MKRLKSIICILIIMGIITGMLSACRSSEQEQSSGYVSDAVTGIVDKENSESIDNAVSDGSNNVGSTELKPQDISSSENSDPSTSSGDTQESKPTLKPYSGSLPSISFGKIPDYPDNKFEISGFWAPYEISEASFQMYKDAGFNTLAMINHSLSKTSENQFYFGSDRTMKALEMCRKVGLKAILNYNDWVADQCGDSYNTDTPFSKYDIYGEYKDIISGVHICDEPKDTHYPIYGNETIINDFKKVYPNKNYIVNLIPITASANAYGFPTYQIMLDTYAETFLKPFDKPLISVDLYPFHTRAPDTDLDLALNYQMIANTAKEWGADQTFILQASTGNEFEEELSEGDMRWQINAALAFGADNLQYYCYAIPRSQTGDVTNYMYNYCILKQDDTPSKIYYYLQEIHKEIQSYADVIRAYNWDQSVGVWGETMDTYRIAALVFNTFEDPKHYVSSKGSYNFIVNRFVSEKYGEAYMFVNFADRNNSNTIEATFRDCKAIAVYGGEGYSGTPKIVNLDKDGKTTIKLGYGDGVFVTPLI